MSSTIMRVRSVARPLARVSQGLLSIRAAVSPVPMSRPVSRQLSSVRGGQRLLEPSAGQSSPAGPVFRRYVNLPPPPPLTPEAIGERVMHVLAAFDKIDPEKLQSTSHFMKDLGLDSLDHVEVVMAMEDEFGFEIPDEEAEKLLCPEDIVEYIGHKKDVCNRSVL